MPNLFDSENAGVGQAPSRTREVDPMQEWNEKVERTREIVKRYQAGEKLTPNDKQIVFEVVTETVKGLGGERERTLEKKFGQQAETEEPGMDAGMQNQLNNQVMEQNQLPPVSNTTLPERP